MKFSYFILIFAISKIVVFTGLTISSISNLGFYRHYENKVSFNFEKPIKLISFHTLLSVRTKAIIYYEDIIDTIEFPDNIWKGKKIIQYHFKKPTIKDFIKDFLILKIRSILEYQ